MHCGHRRRRHEHISLYPAVAISLASSSSPYSQLLTSYMGSWTLCSYIYAWMRPIYPFRSTVASCPLATSTTRAYACPCAVPFHGHVNQMRHQRRRRWSSRTGTKFKSYQSSQSACMRPAGSGVYMYPPQNLYNIMLHFYVVMHAGWRDDPLN